MKKLFLSIIALGISYGAFAQEVAESATDPHLFQKIMTTTVFIIGGLVILAAVLTLLRLSESMSSSIVKQYLSDQGKTGEIALETAAKAPKKQSWLQRLTAAVPVEKQDEIAFDHAFDGIRELDNKLPPWWVGMFYVTIVIGVAFFMYDVVLDMNGSSGDRYEQEMAVAEEAKKARLASLGSQIDETNVELLTDAAALEAGQAEFVAKCAACHLADGGGSVGPNLTDKYWLHGGSVQDVFKTIKYGVPAKGMIAWESQLTPPQMQNIASFILSLQGTTPATAKDPQGELYVAESTTETTDSTATAPEVEGDAEM